MCHYEQEPKREPAKIPAGTCGTSTYTLGKSDSPLCSERPADALRRPEIFQRPTNPVAIKSLRYIKITESSPEATVQRNRQHYRALVCAKRQGSSKEPKSFHQPPFSHETPKPQKHVAAPCTKCRENPPVLAAVSKIFQICCWMAQLAIVNDDVPRNCDSNVCGICCHPPHTHEQAVCTTSPVRVPPVPLFGETLGRMVTAQTTQNDRLIATTHVLWEVGNFCGSGPKSGRRH